MLRNYILLFPFAICFGYLMQMLMRRNKTPLLKVVIALVAALAVYYLCYSYECDPQSSELSLLIADLLVQWITPVTIPLGMAIMNGLKRQKMFSTSVRLSFIPGILLGLAGTSVHVFGLGEEAHHWVCRVTFDTVLGIGMTFVFFRNFIMMGGKDFAWHRLLTFFTKNSASRPLMVIGVSLNVFILSMAERLFWGPSTFNDYIVLGTLRLLAISMVLLLLFNALMQAESPWITLKSIFDITTINPEEEEQPEENSPEKEEMGVLPSELPTLSSSESTLVLENVDRLAASLSKYMKDEKAFLQPDISIEKVAAQLGTNRFYISRLVNVEQAMTFRDYINSLRIEYAKDYLKKHPTATQEQVAFACGFSSASYFNRKFKQVAGLSPQDWKNR